MRALACLLSLCLVAFIPPVWSASLPGTQTSVVWSSCGGDLSDSFQCSNISVPLDYGNSSDTRTISLAVNRFLGSDQANRKGAIFFNPGGPGGSGREYVVSLASAFDANLQGKYDLIGWDPRGFFSDPYVACFETRFDTEVFNAQANNFMLDLPTNASTPGLRADLERQINDKTAYMSSLTRRCVSRSGSILPYLGTAYVAKDVDELSRLIEGDQAPINYWGQSYGTAIGQHMVKILPPERLGKIVLDGLVDPYLWREYGGEFFFQGQQDSDKVLQLFASSCVAAGPNCTLNEGFNFTSGDALLAKLDSTIDALYEQSVPVDSPTGGIATAGNIRGLLEYTVFGIVYWPPTASILASAFKGNFTDLVAFTSPAINPEDAKQPDLSVFAGNAITCADTKPFTAEHPPPSNVELVDKLLGTQVKYSRRAGEGLWSAGLCHLWEKEGLLPKASLYEGTFDLEDDVLQTPVLLLSLTYDGITPLSYAKSANDRLGNNARLIQTNGAGHTASSQPSLCVDAAVRAYFLNDTVPAQKITQCLVDVQPFQGSEALQRRNGESMLTKAWAKLAYKRLRMGNMRGI